MEERKHILFLAEWFPHPGDQQLGVFIQKHARAAALFHEVTVIHILAGIDQQNNTDIIIKQEEYKLIRVTYKKSRSRITNFFRYRKAFKAAWNCCEKPDLIHLHICGKNAIGRKLFLKNSPFVLTEHWSGYLRKDPGFLIPSFLARETFRKAISISVPSTHLKISLEKITGRTDIQIIPNVIEESSRELKKPVVTKMIVVADMVDEVKNISGILGALNIIERTTDNIQLQVKFIGSGKDRHSLEEKGKQFHSGKIRVIFKDSLTNEEVLDELKTSSFLVVNSRRETFSMITAEALMAGIPVIATRCGGPENFINDSNGILIDVDDTDALAQAIIQMSRNHNSYDPQKLSEPIKKHFSLHSIGYMFREFYKIN